MSESESWARETTVEQYRQILVQTREDCLGLYHAVAAYQAEPMQAALLGTTDSEDPLAEWARRKVTDDAKAIIGIVTAYYNRAGEVGSLDLRSFADTYSNSFASLLVWQKDIAYKVAPPAFESVRDAMKAVVDNVFANLLRLNISLEDGSSLLPQESSPAESSTFGDLLALVFEALDRFTGINVHDSDANASSQVVSRFDSLRPSSIGRRIAAESTELSPDEDYSSFGPCAFLLPDRPENCNSDDERAISDLANIAIAYGVEVNRLAQKRLQAVPGDPRFYHPTYSDFADMSFTTSCLFELGNSVADAVRLCADHASGFVARFGKQSLTAELPFFATFCADFISRASFATEWEIQIAGLALCSDGRDLRPRLLGASNQYFRILRSLPSTLLPADDADGPSWYERLLQSCKQLTSAHETIGKRSVAMVSGEQFKEPDATNGISSGSRYIPDAVKRAVHSRDGGRCVNCNSTIDLQYDHDIPFSLGGSATEHNVRLLCAPCNRLKGARIT